jgi:subtilisin family serine protease
LPAAALQGLRNNPNVDYVEQDQTVSLSTAQSDATWGIARIDQTDLPVGSVYNYDRTGDGVHAFIIDTGIRADHTDLGGRVLPGYNTVSTDPNDTNDCNGHGTHVAGTVGGTRWGVAKQVSLVPVRVLNCRGSGSWSGVIGGVDWVAGQALSLGRTVVANMSLGGGKSAAVNAAVAGAVAKGVAMSVAAGNSNADACNYSPASESSAITVGATTNTDVRASYSNFGTCVDVFAPGSSITSAWYTSNVATNTISGTSMASPHVTGVAALVAEANTAASPAAIASFIVAKSTANRINASSIGTGSPNLLLYSLGTGPATEPPVLTVAAKMAGSKSWVGNGSRIKGWQARATVTVFNTSGGAVIPNATVKGTFTPGGAGTCVTGSNGSCALASTTLALTTSSSEFHVTEIIGSSLNYNDAANEPAWLTIYQQP